VLDRMRAKQAEIRRRTESLPPVRVYFETTGLGWTSGRRSVINEMIRLAGGVNIAGDLNANGRVDGQDIGMLLGNWGNPGLGDLNRDGIVNGADLGILLGNWTTR